MDKLMKQELSDRIDELIISCAIGMGCDEAELMRLTSEYGNVSHSYTLPKRLLAFDFEHEKKIALQLQEQVNNVIVQQRRMYGELGSHGSIFKTRKHKPMKPPKKASPKASPNASPKTSPKASPKTSPKASPKACSPKTRRSYCNVMGGTKRRRRN
jgi:hypothetical protein